MNCTVDLCFLCLTNNENLESILSKNSEGLVIEEKCRYVLNEHVNIKPEVSYHICLTCLKNLEFVYDFKRMCVQNINKLNNYVDNLKNLNGPNKHFKVTLTDLQRLEKNESANESFPQIEVVLVKQEIPDNYDDNALEEDGAIHEDENIPSTSIYSESNKSTNNSTQSQQKTSKPHECDVCKKAFARLYALTIHKRIHTGEKPYQCKYCDKTFSAGNTLLKHTRRHTGENLHECDICDKKFVNKIELFTHKRVHTGERPYECDVCHLTFIQKASLTRHKLKHTGVKPHKCDLCDQSFVSGSNLKVHKRLHTGEMPYECDVCQKKFNHPKLLAEHKYKHTGETPYECNICDKAFIRKELLVRHLQIHNV